jgi:hypothetical protein
VLLVGIPLQALGGYPSAQAATVEAADEEAVVQFPEKLMAIMVRVGAGWDSDAIAR